MRAWTAGTRLSPRTEGVVVAFGPPCESMGHPPGAARRCPGHVGPVCPTTLSGYGKTQEKVSFGERLKQIGQVFSFTAKQDKWFIPLLAAAVLIPLALTVVAVLLGVSAFWIPVGVMVTLLAAVIVLNLRSNAAMMNAAEGQPGAAASLIENMRGDWRVARRPARRRSSTWCTW